MKNLYEIYKTYKIYKIGSLLLVCLFYSQNSKAQHDLQANLRQTNANIASTGLTKGSKMFKGGIGRNYLRFKTLPALRDGEISYAVRQKSELEKIYLRFKADTATVQAFEMRLEKDSIFVVHPTKYLPLGRYKVGDSIKMVRCKTGILFYKNGSLVEVYTLPNNNFIMIGEVIVHNAWLSKGGIQFKQN